jgi:Cu/Ag efflux pump CusA
LTLGAIALGVGAVIAVLFLMAPRTPSFRDRDLMVSLQARPGTSLPEMERVTTRVADVLRSTPGIRDTGAEVGRAITGDQIVGTNSSELWVSMAASANYDRTLAAVRNVVDRVPGISGSVSTYEANRTEGVFGSSRDEVTVRIYGSEYGVLGRQAQRVKRLISSVEGVRRPRVQLPVEQPAVHVEVNLAAALRRGLKPGDVRRAAATLVSGTTVGNFFEQQKVFDVVVRGVPRLGDSLTSMRALLIDKPGGGQVPLGSVASVSIRPEPVDIRHDAVSRYVDVTAAVRGQDTGSVRAEVQRRLSRLAMPLDYHAEVVGPPADAPTSGAAFVTFVLAAVLGIFLVLQAAFGRWRLAAIVMATLPASLLGGVVVALATGNRHALGAAAGLAAVFAIGVRQAIVLVRSAQRLETAESPDRRAAVWRAVDERRGPVLANATITAAVLLPLVLLGDVAGNEITYPMSLVILGGLVTMLGLVLILMPAAYARLPGGPRPAQEPPGPATRLPEKEEQWKPPAAVPQLHS